MRIPFTAMLSLVSAMISIQSGASLAKQLFPALGAQGTTSARLFFAALILFAIWRPWKNLPQGKAWRPLILYGVSLGCMNLLFYIAIARIPLGIAVALEFCGPLAVALWSSRHWRDVVWLACAVTGIVCLLPLHAYSQSLDVLGVLFALGAGVFWRLYIIFGQNAGSDAHGGSTVAWGMAFGAIIACPLGLVTAGSALLDFHLLPIMLGVALLSSVVPYSLEMVALQKLPTKTFSIFMSVEPALAAVIGWIFLHEALSLVQWFAIGMIIIASLGSAVTAKDVAGATENHQ